jgi:hypothetical protein
MRPEPLPAGLSGVALGRPVPQWSASQFRYNRDQAAFSHARPEGSVQVNQPDSGLTCWYSTAEQAAKPVRAVVVKRHRYRAA